MKKIFLIFAILLPLVCFSQRNSDFKINDCIASDFKVEFLDRQQAYNNHKMSSKQGKIHIMIEKGGYYYNNGSEKLNTSKLISAIVQSYNTSSNPSFLIGIYTTEHFYSLGQLLCDLTDKQLNFVDRTVQVYFVE